MVWRGTDADSKRVWSIVDLSGYVFEDLRDGGEFVLKRGRPSVDGPSVLLLEPSAEFPSSACLEQLEHECSLATELDPDWAVRPMALARHNGRTVLLLQDPGGHPLDGSLGPGRRLDLHRALRLGIRIAGAIREMHRSGLVHKDIKPANVLLDDADNVRLTGFGITSRLPREHQAPTPPEFIAGTLAYMAPEQTGRMNRSIDMRADLYAMGVTLYEMLTGTLPFDAVDPMEWVHCHIARQPTPPNERAEGIPEAVAAIVLKLLAKTAEDRYQSAAGVEADLSHCLAELEATGRIASFPLGAHDASDRLLIPEKLYGRELEVNALLDALHRVVARGATEVVLLSGYAGIGKSSIVNELHKVLVPQHAFFASGKLSRYQRNSPYATLAQALQDLVRQLLSHNDVELRYWRQEIQAALGSNAQLLVNLVPELKLIIGEQPPVPDLPPQDRQDRLPLVFKRFLGVFARAEHPLVLFLDDLQWVDAATVELIERLAIEPDVRHLLLICAYRDAEVAASHPLLDRLDKIRAAGGRVREIRLAPLRRDDVERLIGDIVRLNRARSASLAGLVFEKTGGNPFFLIQFVTMLAEEGLLRFDIDTASWLWDVERISAKRITDNVVQLMAAKLNRLPDSTLDVLKQLACLGNIAKTVTLSRVLDLPAGQIHAALWPAVQAGMIFRRGEDYEFLHDRVQEASYALIPEGERAVAHLRTGRALAAQTAPAEFEERIFEIVDQLDRGAPLISLQPDRDELAALNLRAGKRAKAATAYASALRYFEAGRELLAEDGWDRQHRLTFELEFQQAECEFLTDNLPAAEQRLTMLLRQSSDMIDQAAITCVQATLYTAMDRTDRAVEVCLGYLSQVGTRWSATPTLQDSHEEYQLVWRLLGSRPMETLADLPPMTQPIHRATIDVLTAVLPAARSTNENLLPLIVGRMTNLSIEHGNTDASCMGYVLLGAVMGQYFGDYAAGFRLANIGLKLAEGGGLGRFMPRIYLNLGSNVNLWTQHIRTSVDLLRRAFDLGHEAGSIPFTGYCCSHLITTLLADGTLLEEVQREAEVRLDYVKQVRLGLVADQISSHLMLIRSLRGIGSTGLSYDRRGADEVVFERRVVSDPKLVLAACWYWIRAIQARFFAGDYAGASQAADEARPLLWTTPLSFDIVEYHFYAALTLAARFDALPPDEQPAASGALAVHQSQLAVWAGQCAENFAGRAALVAAEIARLQNREIEAQRLYEAAIRSTQAADLVQDEGLCHELAARFYAARGFQTIADAYFRNARGCYLRWGADAKVRQLERLYPQLRQEPARPSSSVSMPADQLDFATIVKVAQAVSGDIELDRLIEALMVTALEHAGAQRGLLLLSQDDELRAEAEAVAVRDKVEVRLRQARLGSGELPETILRYVVRSHESVLLDDAVSDTAFSMDEYIRNNNCRSIFCLPLIKQTRLIGVLYLENSLSSHVFTPARKTVLDLLASQAAIALENARLYTELRQAEAFLEEAQRLSHTGSFGWRVASEEIFWSEETFRIFELDRDIAPTPEIILQRTHPDDVASVRQIVHRKSFDESHWEVEHRLLLPSGAVKTLHVVGHAMKDPSGQLEFVGTVMDVTERKRAEDALRNAQADLARIARLTTIGELAASIAHEVNQPLMAAVTNAAACVQWLSRRTPNLVEARQAAERAVKAGHRAGDVIRTIRGLARKSSPEMSHFNINGVVEEILVLTSSEMRRHDVSVETNLSPGLGQITGDRVQLQQVVLNLIMNAIEAMSGTTNQPRLLRITSKRDEAGDALIAIADTGAGVAPENVDAIFDAFFTTKRDGMGMGLSICRSIVEACGGRLWLSSNQPNGSIFHFVFPAGKPGELPC